MKAFISLAQHPLFPKQSVLLQGKTDVSIIIIIIVGIILMTNFALLLSGRTQLCLNATAVENIQTCSEMP